MKKLYGFTGSLPEYYLVSKTKEKSLVIAEDQKRKKLFLNDARVYADYLKKDIQIVELPSQIDKYDLELQIKRNFALTQLIKSKKPVIAVSDPNIFNTFIRKNFDKEIITITTEIDLDRDYLIHKLVEHGYIREENVENEGEFSVKGGIIRIYIPFIGIFEIDFFGDTVENIFQVSKLNTRKEINQIDIYPLYDEPVILRSGIEIQFRETEKENVSKFLKDTDIYYLNIYTEIGEGVYLLDKVSEGKRTDHSDFKKVRLPLRQPAVLEEEKTVFIPESQENLDFEFSPLEVGDYIIHEDYGIGIFRGIETREIKGKTYDFMILEYAGGEKIYVSYLHFDKIYRYTPQGNVVLDKIGGTSWRNLKRKIKNSLKKVAKELIKLYSQRQQITRPPFDISDELISEFEKSFPYIETPDQLKAINDVKKDMSSNKPMERVICGDVGFGKTEVALRAAFIAAMNGKQTAVLTPTTILSYQHYRNFKERLEPFGIKVENLSRLKSKKETEEILRQLEEGKIDIVIGTHKLLQDNVKFKNLGLLIIDEEHRFGVRAKEKIRHIKKDVDTLYMTATPIPRTLNMALSGLKELSVIKTPPEGRLETKTYVFVENENMLKKAIEFELKRKGQIFYLHNRIDTIEEKAKTLKDMFPQANVAVAHGRMKPKQIEKVILDFIEGKIDILVSTSIIETGIDIPTANTLIVERADLFGLAQLYHLRGRVGRGNIQAYCYLLVPPEISKDAEKRLDAILRLTRPGSGLKISIEDMQIRGAGNILGVEQSGHIKAVGYEMYIKLLQETISEEKGGSEKEPVMVVDIESYIPEEFIPDPKERMNIYMTVSKAIDYQEIEHIRKYLKDFYSGLPDVFELYLEIEKLKKAATGKGINKIELREPVTTIYMDTENPPSPEFIMELPKNFDIKFLSPEKVEIFLNKKEIPKLTELLLRL